MFPGWKSTLAFSLAVLLLAGAGIGFNLSGRANLRLEQFLCDHLLLCWDEAVREEAFRRLWGAEEPDLRRAVAGFEELVRRNPANPFRWCDLAEALMQAGMLERARASMLRAVQLGPNLAAVLVRAGNLCYRTEEVPQALVYHARVLQITDEYDGLVFSTYSRMGVPIQEVLARGIPASTRQAHAYLLYLIGETNLAEAEQTWSWIKARGLADTALAAEYVEFLLDQEKYEAGAAVWAESAGRADPSFYRNDNLVFNGDFELDPAGPLDWRVTAMKGVEVVRDSKVAFSGTWSLRIRFDGTDNVGFAHVSHAVVVPPGTYSFEAAVRTEGITTDEGLSFRIIDGDWYASTQPLTGTTTWTKVRQVVHMPRGRMVQIRLVRRRSQKFDNKIQGTAWVDAVTFRPIQTGAAIEPPE